MGLKRELGPVTVAWLVAGNMIGAGIFITPGLVVDWLPGMMWPLAAWMLGGVLALCGAAIYGELGARFPQAGGDYQYLTLAYGPAWGFLMGWAALAITFSGSAAAMAIAVVAHCQAAWPILQGGSPAIQLIYAPLLVLLLTLANIAGARVAGRTTVLLTALPLVGLAGLFSGGLLFSETATHWPEPPAIELNDRLLALGAAMVPVFFTYSGWNAAAYVAGEIKDPGQNLPRGLLGGTLLVILLYLLINLLLLMVVPQEILTGSTTAGTEAARRLLGPGAEQPLSVMIAVAILGSTNVTLMAGARIYYAMACDGLAPPIFSRTNAAGAPSGALWISGLWTALLAATGGIELLVNWATLAILLLSSMAAASLFIFRRRNETPPPFSCPGYPLTPLLYLLASLGVAFASAIHNWEQALYGILLVATGLPLYKLIRRWM
ncbi:amino acid permease-associated region [Nitrosococcus halophilus Nc 4]|uniref:Amino acid permease-associated region n=1 Tax=Nitrosococcus halophilus (strain Nc4) TaxID=472759 RepID=D5C4I0_NITHN|nr:APC family permease [Nitrosococcus halophilus]ADE15164.1 amino acid permease-associated region [Nitrosococcus halophilus Nc 4]